MKVASATPRPRTALVGATHAWAPSTYTNVPLSNVAINVPAAAIRTSSSRYAAKQDDPTGSDDACALLVILWGPCAYGNASLSRSPRSHWLPADGTLAWSVPSPSPVVEPHQPIVRPPEPIAQQLEAQVHGVAGAFAGIYYRNLLSAGDTIAIDADSIFHAASTMKIAVMIQLFREVDAGELSLDQTVVVRNQFASIVDGTPYTLDPKDDSDSAMYTMAGQAVSVRELMMRMIQRSSNLATNTVIALVGAARVDSTAHALGATHMRVLRGVEDSKAFARGLNNVTSARDLAALLIAIYANRAASPADCAAMLDVLLGQEFNTEIPAGLPPGTRVAHKTGNIVGVLHDAAIVYPTNGPPYGARADPRYSRRARGAGIDRPHLTSRLPPRDGRGERQDRLTSLRMLGRGRPVSAAGRPVVCNRRYGHCLRRSAT